MTQQELSLDFRIDVVPISLATLRPYPTNPRTHQKNKSDRLPTASAGSASRIRYW